MKKTTAKDSFFIPEVPVDLGCPIFIKDRVTGIGGGSGRAPYPQNPSGL